MQIIPLLLNRCVHYKFRFTSLIMSLTINPSFPSLWPYCAFVRYIRGCWLQRSQNTLLHNNKLSREFTHSGNRTFHIWASQVYGWQKSSFQRRKEEKKDDVYRKSEFITVIWKARSLDFPEMLDEQALCMVHTLRSLQCYTYIRLWPG